MDAQTLAGWVEAHGAALVLYARQWVDAPTADDVVQEAFIHLAGLGEKPGHVRAWLLTAVRNGAIDALRKRKRDAARMKEVGERRWFEVREGKEVVMGEEIEAGLKGLGPEQREVITLRIWAGATFEEVAAVTGLPLSTVYLRYRTGLEELKARWELPCRKK